MTAEQGSIVDVEEELAEMPKTLFSFADRDHWEGWKLYGRNKGLLFRQRVQ